MLKNILNIEGVHEMNKEEQKNIQGGKRPDNPPEELCIAYGTGCHHEGFCRKEEIDGIYFCCPGNGCGTNA